MKSFEVLSKSCLGDGGDFALPSWWECAEDCGLEPELRRGEQAAVASEWSEFEAVHLDEGPEVFMKPPERPKALPLDLNSTSRTGLLTAVSTLGETSLGPRGGAQRGSEKLRQVAWKL